MTVVADEGVGLVGPATAFVAGRLAIARAAGVVAGAVFEGIGFFAPAGAAVVTDFLRVPVCRIRGAVARGTVPVELVGT